MNISDYTRKEINYLLEECNFTESQKIFFLMRSKDVSIEQCAEQMNISVSCANNISKKIKDKIQKVLV